MVDPRAHPVHHDQSVRLRWTPDLLLVPAALLCGGCSLLLYGVFLWVGPLRVVAFGLSDAAALLFDAALSALFFLQHSGMVRRGIRQRLVRSIPRWRFGAIYAIASGALLTFVVLVWQPVGPTLLSIEGTPRVILRVVFLLPLALVGWTYLAQPAIDPLGTGSLLDHAFGRPERRSPIVTHGPYGIVRHPMYAAALLMLWAHPTWTADRLLLAVVWSVWIALGTRLEDRDLVAEHGEPYATYQQRVPMLVPRLTRPRGEDAPSE